MEEHTETKNWHDKYYKKLLIIPILFLLISLVYIGIFYSQNKDFIHKDISLTGGTSVTLYEQIDIEELEQDLIGQLEDLNVRKISDLITNEQKAIIIETKADADTTKQVVED